VIDAYDLLPLWLLRAGQLGHVGELVGPADQVHRLEEMGLRTGAQIEVLQPGRACIVRLGEQKVCFRSDEATRVLVRCARSA
jgi:Fe2+ transport system protein FeoA